MRSVAPRVGMALLALSATCLSSVRSDEYFTGDGTTYTLGETFAGNCNFMAAPAAAAQNYAALNNDQWLGTKNCGRCAEVACADARCASTTTKEIVYILDRCPECKHGDLDLSPTVFSKITGNTPSRLTIKWKFVDCPVSGAVKYCLKGGSNNFWTAVQPTNTVAGVSSMLINGKTPTMVDSAYYYLLNGQSTTQTDLGSVKVTLTSVGGEVLEETVALSAGACTDGKLQFKTGNAGGSNTGGGSGQQQTTTAPPATTSPPTSAPTPKPTAAPVTPTPVKQKEVGNDASEVTPSPSPSPSPTPSQKSNSTSTVGITMDRLGSDAGLPGTVSAADDASSSALLRLTSAPVSEDRSMDNTADDSKTPSPSSSGSSKSSSDGGVTGVTTKTSVTDSGTSPVLIVLAVAAAVGAVALAVVAGISHKKKLDDKRVDREDRDRAMQRSFDNFASPVRVGSEIAEL